VPLECTDGELASRLRDETVRPFNLEAGPLLRVTLYQREAQRHVLLLVAHHIIADGWSMGVLARELGELYRAFAAGLAPTLAPLPVQYGDFASWQRTWLAGEALERELEYWRRQLAGAPAALELPTDRPRPAMFSHRGARYHFTLPRELADALSALSRREGVTLFMTLLAAFQVLLSRYSGQDDLVIGSPVANRSRPEIEGLIGFFVNTLVLRTALSNVRSFRELLFRVRETCLGAYAHQELPFEKLVQELKPERDTSRNPLFQVMLVLQNMALPPLDLGAVSVVPLDIERTTSQVDLTLYLRETGDGLLGTFEYATDLFNAVTIEGMARHLQRLLQGFAEAPEADLTIPLMPDEECRALLHRYDTRQDYPRDRTVVELIEAQAARRPAARALRHEQAELDYAGLTARSNRLAAYLRSRGLGPGSLVGVCVERGIDMVVSLLAILKAGAAYLPLDPAFPAERLHYMLEDSGAKALVTHATLDQELFSGVDLCRIRLDGDRDAIEQQSPEPLAAAGPGPLDRAYVIYTSGSSGRPKGVEIPHGALTNFLCSMAREPGLTADDVLVAVTTISFDISLLELFLPLTVGGRVVLADREQVADAARLAALLQASAATAMQATPSLWRLLVDSGWQGGGHFKVLCGGEPLPPDLARALSERSGELWNLYGPTETTVWSTCERIRSLDGPLSIGKPIANTRVYVLDERLEPVPPLVAGELFIAGDGVATGYLHRPELTAERFLPDRFATNDAEGRMYRTGDKARWLQDGRLEHLGRLDNQVKLRGFRIEVGEIETVLRSHSAVHEAAVAVWQAGAADQRLVAYVVPTSGTPPIADLRKHLRSRLPDYMIPQHFIVQDALPLTPNGKLDRRALPPPLQQPSGTGEVAEPPVGATEVLIADIWKQVIGCAAVSRDDNFFDAGGHSMLAIEAIARIEERTGWRPSPRLLILESLKEIALQCDQAVRRPATERNLLSRLKGLVRAGD
jgi:amino acid adenylation domain-containing protein